MYSIYKLVDPRDKAIFYIGMTIMPIDKRLKGHIQSKRSYPLNDYIRKMIADGYSPEIQLIERTKSREREYHHIFKHLPNGRLLNIIGATNTHGYINPRKLARKMRNKSLKPYLQLLLSGNAGTMDNDDIEAVIKVLESEHSKTIKALKSLLK